MEVITLIDDGPMHSFSHAVHRGLVIGGGLVLGGALLFSASHALLGLTQASADLAVTQTASENSTAGSLLTYQTTVRNLGPFETANVQITIVQPFTSYSNGKIYAATFQPITDSRCHLGTPNAVQNIVCDLGTMASGASATIQTAARVPGDFPCNIDLYSSARITGSKEFDTNTANNSSTVTTLIGGCRYPVTYTFAQDRMSALPGEAVTFTMTFQETGNNDQTAPGWDIAFSNLLLPKQESVAFTPPANQSACVRNGQPPPGHYECFFRPLPVHQSVTFTLPLIVRPETTCGQTIPLTFTPIFASPQNAAKPNGAFTVSIAVSCPPGMHPPPSSHASVPPVSPTAPPPSKPFVGCTDSDGGIKPNQAGTVRTGTVTIADQCYVQTTTNGKATYAKTQNCTGNNCILSEAYCVRGAYATRIGVCVHGCSSGACRP